MKNPSQGDLDELESCVEQASKLLHIPRTSKQEKLFDRARAQVIYMQIRVNEQHLDDHGDRYKNLQAFKGLRPPEEFAKKKMFGKKKLAEGMCYWAKAKIPT